jgi:hypothetical protein
VKEELILQNPFTLYRYYHQVATQSEYSFGVRGEEEIEEEEKELTENKRSEAAGRDSNLRNVELNPEILIQAIQIKAKELYIR